MTASMRAVTPLATSAFATPAACSSAAVGTMPFAQYGSHWSVGVGSPPALPSPPTHRLVDTYGAPGNMELSR